MDQRPLYLGRGRGRGRASGQNAGNSSHGRGRGKTGDQTKGKPGPMAGQKDSASRERMQAAQRIQESAKKFSKPDDYGDSSSDEDVNDVEILSKTLKVYKNATQGTWRSSRVDVASSQYRVANVVMKIPTDENFVY